MHLRLARLFERPRLEGVQVQQAQFSPNGRWLFYLRSGASDPQIWSLWGIQLDPIRPPQQILEGEVSRALTSQKIHAEEVFSWCGSSRVVVTVDGWLYLIDLREGRPEARRLFELEGEVDYRCDPTGKRLLFSLPSGLWLMDLACSN